MKQLWLRSKKFQLENEYDELFESAAYHNEWYKNSVGEAGWKDNKVYTPSETYGKGKYYPN